MPDVILDKKGNERLWDETAPTYQRIGPDFTAMFANGLIKRMSVSPGARVLDVATGTGSVLFPAAKQVGANGHATGIDISSKMLEEAKRAAVSCGLNNVDLLKMDAEHLEFPDRSFDLVTCALGLFYLTDIDAGVREIYRVCKPGGYIGVVTFNKNPGPPNPGVPILIELSTKYGKRVRSAYPTAWSAEEVRALLCKQPFRSVDVVDETFDLTYTDIEEWWGCLMSMGPTRATILAISEDGQANFKEEYFARLKPLLNPNGLHMKVGAVYAIAQK